jgi:asparagine synthase (glutamine-hydrolysing)
VFDTGPILSRAGKGVLVADVRLDNREELCSALGVTAPEGRLMSDAAIVMAAIDRWGVDAIARLYGDFALAFWDAAQGRLVLARDFLGQRPLFFHSGSGFFAFASMAKGLHSLERIPYQIDTDTLAKSVALLSEQGEQSFFHGIRKVAPGHIVEVSREGIKSHAYWSPPLNSLRLGKPGDYQDALREQMDRAVAARLRSIQPNVATHLSAGLDSATVTATAARLLAGGNRRIVACTAAPREGYDAPPMRGELADEAPHAAKLAARHANVDHAIVRSGHLSPVSHLDRNFLLYERPFQNLANHVWISAILSELKERRISVLLTGAMGNMSFSYDGFAHLTALVEQRSPVQLLGLIGGLLKNRVSPHAILRHARKGLGSGRGNSAKRHAAALRRIQEYSAIDPGKLEALDLADLEEPRGDPRLWVLRRVDHGNYNKGMLGGWGVDVRDPTADRALIEFCLSIPVGEFIRGGLPRALARRSFADRLPAQIVRERRTGYQAADWHEGMAGSQPDVSSELSRLAAVPGANEILDLPRLQNLLRSWPAADWNDPSLRMAYRLVLLRAISAGHFLRKTSRTNS